MEKSTEGDRKKDARGESLHRCIQKDNPVRNDSDVGLSFAMGMMRNANCSGCRSSPEDLQTDVAGMPFTARRSAAMSLQKRMGNRFMQGLAVQAKSRPDCASMAGQLKSGIESVSSPSQTIQRTKFNKNGDRSFFGSHDTKNEKDFTDWIRTLDDVEILKKIAAALAKDKSVDHLMLDVVRHQYNLKRLERQEQSGPAESDREQKLRDANSRRLMYEKITIEDAEYQRETEKTISDIYTDPKIQRTIEWAEEIDRQLQQAIIDAEMEIEEFSQYQREIEQSMGLALQAGTDETPLEEELDKLQQEIEMAQQQKEINSRISPKPKKKEKEKVLE